MKKPNRSKHFYTSSQYKFEAVKLQQELQREQEVKKLLQEYLGNESS
jgi:hypothetical protein